MAFVALEGICPIAIFGKVFRSKADKMSEQRKNAATHCCTDSFRHGRGSGRKRTTKNEAQESVDRIANAIFWPTILFWGLMAWSIGEAFGIAAGLICGGIVIAFAVKFKPK